MTSEYSSCRPSTTATSKGHILYCFLSEKKEVLPQTRLKGKGDRLLFPFVTPIISETQINKALRGKTGEITPLADAQSEFERNYLVQILQITRGNVTQAAQLAKRNRTEFYKLLARHQLEPKVFRHD